MRDAIGGTFALVMIVFFIVFALGYLAFNVNYTKAFRMKDKVLAVYEEHDGQVDTVEFDDAKKNDIKGYADEIGYDIGDYNCPVGYDMEYDCYCVKKVPVYSVDGSSEYYPDGVERYYFSIVTKIYFEIPIINKFLDIDVFEVKGDTRTFKSETD